jgi:hypothetical protein
MFRVFESLMGVRALPVSDERFLRAWHAIMVRGMGAGDGDASSGGSSTSA